MATTDYRTKMNTLMNYKQLSAPVKSLLDTYFGENANKK